MEAMFDNIRWAQLYLRLAEAVWPRGCGTAKLTLRLRGRQRSSGRGHGGRGARAAALADTDRRHGLGLGGGAAVGGPAGGGGRGAGRLLRARLEVEEVHQRGAGGLLGLLLEHRPRRRLGGGHGLK